MNPTPQILKALLSIVVLLSTACGDDLATVDDPLDMGKADDAQQTGDTQSGTFHVFNNGILCITAPCPSYTVITPGGITFPIAGVDADITKYEGGATVIGNLVEGSWQPMEPGTTLRVRKVEDGAHQFLARAVKPDCDTCRQYMTLEEDGTEHLTGPVDLSTLPLSTPEAQDIVRDQLDRGLVAVTGFMAMRDWRTPTLYVTGVAGETEDYRMQAKHAVCEEQPCSQWNAVSHDGQRHDVADLNLSFLQLSEADEASLLRELEGGSVRLLGWMNHDSWDAGGRGTTLFATQVLPSVVGPL